MGSSEEREKFCVEKNDDASIHTSNVSLDWQFGGSSLAYPWHFSPADHSNASCSSTSMFDSFSASIWGHHNSQNFGFGSNNSHTCTRSSSVMSSMNINPGILRPVDTVALNNLGSIQHYGGLSQSEVGVFPHGLSQFPMDSSFVERAASSCFGSYSNVANPFSMPQSLKPDVKVGADQTLNEQDTCSLKVLGLPFQKNESRMGEIGKDGLLVDHELMEGPSKNGGKARGVKRSSDESQIVIGSPNNDFVEAKLDIGGQEEASAMENAIGEPFIEDINVKKRKSSQDVDLEQVKGSPRLSIEMRKENIESKEEKGEQNPTSAAVMAFPKQNSDVAQNSDVPKQDYIHVRARRGQATNSHSLAERVRREKISERMKLLQDLVPGCNKVTGKAVMLDEIINYVQSLQRQVEFLSMKLATVNPQIDFNIEDLMAKDIFQSHGRTPATFGFMPSVAVAHSQLHPLQQGLIQAGIPSIGNHSDLLRGTVRSPLSAMNSYKETAQQTGAAWNGGLHNAVDVSSPFNSQELGGTSQPDDIKS